MNQVPNIWIRSCLVRGSVVDTVSVSAWIPAVTAVRFAVRHKHVSYVAAAPPGNHLRPFDRLRVDRLRAGEAPTLDRKK